MRYNIIKQFLDKFYSVNIPEEIYTAINSKCDSLKNCQSQTILYANKFGPLNITELINEIKKEL